MNFAVLGILVIAAYVAVLWVALAFYVVRDARRRTSSRGFQAFALVFGFFPPFIGALVYFIVRPPRTMEEERTLALEEMALRPLDDGPEQRPCPSCGRDIASDFVICPYCRTQFARRCGSCDRMLRLGWTVCPYCAEEVGVHPLSRQTRTASR